MSKKALLCVGDWNYQDKYYRIPTQLLKEFATKIKTDNDMHKSWDWFVELIEEKKIKRLKVIPVDEDQFFLDYNNPIDSINEWDWSE